MLSLIQTHRHATRTKSMNLWRFVWFCPLSFFKSLDVIDGAHLVIVEMVRNSFFFLYRFSWRPRTHWTPITAHISKKEAERPCTWPARETVTTRLVHTVYAVAHDTHDNWSHTLQITHNTHSLQSQRYLLYLLYYVYRTWNHITLIYSIKCNVIMWLGIIFSIFITQ